MNPILKSLCIALGERDAETRQHSDRVIELTRALGIHIELNTNELETLCLGACLHDIGKIGIPDRILFKPGRFCPEERKAMQGHALIGERIVRAIDDERSDELSGIVRHHHENFDGSGYPDALCGTAIPLHARIVSLADNYDALATSRPYHPGRPHREIIDLMSGPDAEKFDPDLLHAFRHVIEHSPMRVA
jgi:HD-GYP domain-containing protein (c-di-GMP phosphodiesterase class II)